jgi:hypothetical protein
MKLGRKPPRSQVAQQPTWQSLLAQGVTGAYLDDLAGDELPIGSFRSTKPRRPRASANARFSLSTSSGLNLPSFNRRLIGIPAPVPVRRYHMMYVLGW